MGYQTITINKQKYYIYDTYETREEAYKTAKYYKKKIRGNKYFIIKVEIGWLFPEEKYKLYMTKLRKLWH